MLLFVKTAITVVTSTGFSAIATNMFGRVLPAANLTRYGKLAMWTTSTATGLALAKAVKPATDEYVDEIADGINKFRK
jgi:hypothetical protein